MPRAPMQVKTALATNCVYTWAADVSSRVKRVSTGATVGVTFGGALLRTRARAVLVTRCRHATSQRMHCITDDRGNAIPNGNGNGKERE